MSEEWKSIMGFEGKYEISNYGKVKSLSRYIVWGNSKFKSKNRYLTTNADSRGYPQVRLSVNNVNKNIRLSRLVALHFIKNDKNYKEINHIDGNKLNNRADNLEWCTRSYNIKHAFATGLKKAFKKKIKQFKNNMFIECFDSIKDASIKTKIKACNISRSASTEYYKAGGYDWRYIV